MGDAPLNRSLLPSVPRPRTPLDDRVEKLTRYSPEQLRRHHADGLLAGELAALADAHRELANEERGVAYHLGRLHQLSDGQDRGDAPLLERLARVVRYLTEAVARRDATLAATTAVLEPLERAVHTADEGKVPELTPPDFAHLLALVRGARLHEHLVTQRLSVVTATGTRVPYPALQRLEGAGLVTVDRAHPLCAGQPVALTGLGRRTLIGRPTALATGRPSASSSTPPVFRR